MKQKILIGVAGGVVVLLLLFVILKPKAPDFGSIAVVTENENAILPLPELGENIRRYRLEPGSVMTWTGRKIGGFHDGTVNVLQGAFAIDDDGQAAGRFIIDMDSIVITDMSEDNPMYNQLLNHLRDGFFDIANYPTVEFDLKRATMRPSGIYDIVGNLKLKGVSREITFPAEVVIGEEEMTAKASFFVDRTAWGIEEVIQIADRYIEFGIDFVFERL